MGHLILQELVSLLQFSTVQQVHSPEKSRVMDRLDGFTAKYVYDVQYRYPYIFRVSERGSGRMMICPALFARVLFYGPKLR
jgi:hypothetical protein